MKQKQMLANLSNDVAVFAVWAVLSPFLNLTWKEMPDWLCASMARELELGNKLHAALLIIRVLRLSSSREELPLTSIQQVYGCLAFPIMKFTWLLHQRNIRWWSVMSYSRVDAWLAWNQRLSRGERGWAWAAQMMHIYLIFYKAV